MDRTTTRNTESRRRAITRIAAGTLSLIAVNTALNINETSDAGNDFGSTSESQDTQITSVISRAPLLRTLVGSVRTALAQCIGPDVLCTTPDGIDRRAFADVYRTVKNGTEDFAVSDAAIRVYLLKPIGTSTYPELDRQNPELDSNGLPAAFRDLKPGGGWRTVEKSFLFKAAEPGDPRFNGKLINAETGEDRLTIFRGGNEIKDRVNGRVRDTEGCPSDDCGLNCAEVVVFERQVSGKDARPFINSLGRFERYQVALWLWELGEKNPSIHNLGSSSNISQERVAELVAKGEIARTTVPQFKDLSYQIATK